MVVQDQEHNKSQLNQSNLQALICRGAKVLSTALQVPSCQVSMMQCQNAELALHDREALLQSARH